MSTPVPHPVASAVKRWLEDIEEPVERPAKRVKCEHEGALKTAVKWLALTEEPRRHSVWFSSPPPPSAPSSKVEFAMSGVEPPATTDTTSTTRTRRSTAWPLRTVDDLCHINIRHERIQDHGSLQQHIDAIENGIENFMPRCLEGRINEELKNQRPRDKAREHELCSIGMDDTEEEKEKRLFERLVKIQHKASALLEASVGMAHDCYTTDVVKPIFAILTKESRNMDWQSLGAIAINPQYRPAIRENHPNPQLKGMQIGKKVDGGIFLKVSQAEKTAVKSILKDCSLQSINHFNLALYTEKPLALSIEVKVTDDSSNGNVSRIQLATWALSQINSLRVLLDRQGAPPQNIVLPLISVRGKTWYLMFFKATDIGGGAENFVLGPQTPIGSVESIKECYRILAILRIIFRWLNTTYRDWFMGTVLGIGARPLTPASSRSKSRSDSSLSSLSDLS